MSNKPAWCKDAVATTAGWVNSKTNELLVCAKNLPDALSYVKGKIVWDEKAKPEVAVVVEAVEKAADESKVEKKNKKSK